MHLKKPAAVSSGLELAFEAQGRRGRAYNNNNNNNNNSIMIIIIVVILLIHIIIIIIIIIVIIVIIVPIRGTLEERRSKELTDAWAGDATLWSERHVRVCVCVCIHMYTYIYIYIERERCNTHTCIITFVSLC